MLGGTVEGDVYGSSNSNGSGKKSVKEESQNANVYYYMGYKTFDQNEVIPTTTTYTKWVDNSSQTYTYENYHFNIHKAVVVEEGSDVTLLTNGELLCECILAAEELKKDGISVRVVNVPVVKPIDKTTIIDCAKETKFLITVENHSTTGGLGSAVCEVVCGNYPAKVFRIGIHDEFGQSGKSDELVKYYGLDSANLVKRIKSMYAKEVN